MNKTKKGFTLIELLVVIAIIGILSSIVIASLNNARKKSRDARRVADIKQVQLALEMYFDSNRSYPVTLAELVSGQHIASEPKDPIGNTSYSYATSGTAGAACTSAGKNCMYYHLGASLEEQTNLALTTDKDCSSTGTSCPTGAIYPNNPFVSGSGEPESLQKCKVGDNGNYCYDVIP